MIYIVLGIGIAFVISGAYAIGITLYKNKTCLLTKAKVIANNSIEDEYGNEFWDNKLKFDCDGESTTETIRITHPIELGSEIDIIYNRKNKEILINKSSLPKYIILLILGLVLIGMYFVGLYI